MKLPLKKQKQLKAKGKPDSPPVAGGGAMGRLRQFQQERGIATTELSNPASEEPQKSASKRHRAKKR